MQITFNNLLVVNKHNHIVALGKDANEEVQLVLTKEQGNEFIGKTVDITISILGAKLEFAPIDNHTKYDQDWNPIPELLGHEITHKIDKITLSI